MFEKEFITQKTVLFVSLIFILYFSCKSYLSEKNGISSQEGATYAISNTSESLSDSPYAIAKYETEPIQKDIIDQPLFMSLRSIFFYIHDIAKQPENNSVLATYSGYNNKTWIESSYYTSLLSVSQNNQFQYDQVVENCILTQRPPLYYSLLHTISCIFGSLHLYRLGFSINVCFLFFTALCMLTMGKKYFHSSWVGLVAALMYALSLGCFSSIVCATPYVMVSFFLLLTVRIHLSILRKSTTPIYLYEALALVNIVGNLTDYSYFGFCILLCLCFSVALILLHRPKEFLCYITFQLASILATTLFYPATILHLCTIAIETFHQFFSNFKLEAFRTNCISNLSILSSQLFMHTAILMLFLLILLVVFAAFLRRGSLLSHLADFFERMSTGDVADLLTPALVLFYFVGISFFSLNDNYFILTTLLPFSALIISYVIYRLCNAAINSEFNSGICCITITCLLCMISITTSTPKYLYTDTIDKTAFASAYAEEYCIFLSSDTLKASDYILELEKYEHSIVLSADRIRSLKNDETFLEQNSVLVYLSTNDYVDSVIDQIAKLGEFEIVQPLTDYADEYSNHVYIYQLRKTI